AMAKLQLAGEWVEWGDDDLFDFLLQVGPVKVVSWGKGLGACRLEVCKNSRLLQANYVDLPVDGVMQPGWEFRVYNDVGQGVTYLDPHDAMSHFLAGSLPART